MQHRQAKGTACPAWHPLNLMPNLFIIVTHALLAALLLSAVTIDFRSRRIPNRLVLAGMVLALAFHAFATVTGAPPLAGPAAWAPLAGLVVGFALLLPLYLLGAMGAGDVKLMAMVGAFIGAQPVLVAALYTFLAGGLLSLAFMLGRGVAAQTLANIRFMLIDWFVRANTGQGARLSPLQTTASRLPYALAIALGTGSALLWPFNTP